MSTTAISADPNLPSPKAAGWNTTAFDQDNRQRTDVVELLYHDMVRALSSIHPASSVSSQQVLLKEGLVLAGSDVAAKAILGAGYIRSPRSCFVADMGQLLHQSRNSFREYRDRIEELKRDAEDEGIVFNNGSEQDFWDFMRSIPYAVMADLVVTDRGNLRAVWDGEDSKHMGLQFLGDRRIEYVMWTRRAGSMQISPKAGRDTFEGVKEQIRASGLTSFLQSS